MDHRIRRGRALPATFLATLLALTGPASAAEPDASDAAPDVEDLTDAHLLAVRYLLDGGASDVFNAGTAMAPRCCRSSKQRGR